MTEHMFLLLLQENLMQLQRNCAPSHSTREINLIHLNCLKLLAFLWHLPQCVKHYKNKNFPIPLFFKFYFQVKQNLPRIYTNKWIGRRGPIEWPARSPELTCLDIFCGDL